MTYYDGVSQKKETLDYARERRRTTETKNSSCKNSCSKERKLYSRSREIAEMIQIIKNNAFNQ